MFNFDKSFQPSSTKNAPFAFDDLYSFFSGESSWNSSSQLDQYHKSLYVFAAVNKIATKVANINWQLFEFLNLKGDSDEIVNHEILDLLTKVNPYQTKTEFLRTSWINKKLTGETFHLKVRNNSGKVVELWNLRPDMMTVVSDEDSYIKHYVFSKPDGSEEIFSANDIIHIKDPDPLNPLRGLSPLIASKSRIETEKDAASFQRNFFANNARPDALLISEYPLDDEQRQQMVRSWEDRHQSTRRSGNQGRIGILEGGMSYQQIAVTQREMDYIESMRFTRSDILVALGVPETVITSSAANYATAENDYRIFLSETVVPEMQQLVEVLNEFLIVPDFGEKYFLEFEDPTPEDRQSKREDHEAGYGKWLTTNEIRESYSLPPLEGGDVIPETSSRLTPEPTENKVSPETRIKNLKRLQGRPFLRLGFEVKEMVEKEVENVAKKIKTEVKNKSVKTKSKTLVSLFPDQKLKTKFYDLTNKQIDDRAKVFEKTLQEEFALQEQRVLTKLRALHNETRSVSKGNKKEHQKILHAQLADILDVELEKNLFSFVSLPFLLEYAELSAQEMAELLGEVFNMTPSLTQTLEKRAEFFSESITDTTFKNLVETLSTGINEGEGIAKLAARVREVYGNIETHRAFLIARTETTYANNVGILEEFKESEVVHGKEWINSGDSRVRDAHENAPIGVGGEIVSLDGTFSNGLEFPQEINCRCTLLPAIYM